MNLKEDGEQINDNLGIGRSSIRKLIEKCKRFYYQPQKRFMEPGQPHLWSDGCFDFGIKAYLFRIVEGRRTVYQFYFKIINTTEQIGQQ